MNAPQEQTNTETAELRRELEEARREAIRLATVIWRSEFQSNAPEWTPLDTVAGVISQIDNMFAGVRGQRDAARRVIEQDKAFAGKINKLTQGISELPLGKTVHENLFDAVKRVLSERDAAEKMVAEMTTALNCALRAADPEEDWNKIARTIQDALASSANIADKWVRVDSLPVPVPVDLDEDLKGYQSELQTVEAERDQLRAELERVTKERDLREKRRACESLRASLERTQQDLEALRTRNVPLCGRITEYLTAGGLFNPEAMEHDKVRDLLMDIRAALTPAQQEEGVQA